ncbi:MAG: helix-turn-helix transcriptional regulator [Clostridia bacterium]|nr:helix-turn-helix transcriptional regulator [Clostridia bacterium]
MKLSEKIVFLRKRQGMSQEQLANELDVSRQAVYKWETGITTPEIEKLIQAV